MTILTSARSRLGFCTKSMAHGKNRIMAIQIILTATSFTRIIPTATIILQYLYTMSKKKGILPLKIKFDDTNIDEVETTFSFWENGETITSVKYNGKIIEQWQPKFTINE